MDEEYNKNISNIKEKPGFWNKFMRVIGVIILIIILIYLYNYYIERGYKNPNTSQTELNNKQDKDLKEGAENFIPGVVARNEAFNKMKADEIRLTEECRILRQAGKDDEANKLIEEHKKKWKKLKPIIIGEENEKSSSENSKNLQYTESKEINNNEVSEVHGNTEIITISEEQVLGSRLSFTKYDSFTVIDLKGKVEVTDPSGTRFFLVKGWSYDANTRLVKSSPVFFYSKNGAVLTIKKD